MLKMAAEASVKAFFASPQFAVAGASSNPAKFGHKVFVWYKDHQLPVIPINPAPSISTRYGEHATVKSVSELSDPRNTSLSVITPPPVTLEILKEAKRVGVPAVWLQPGTFDDEVMGFARGKDTGGYDGEVIAGEGGAGSEGWCVLVDGERGMRSAGKL
ncbi:CoA binding domain-containing protein [Xylaria bambusicola]|uniref:CoA binding domain-containing protein n=1 Tax=Xylaria bambusicola TaxID=326684 RepID=UPI00200739DA|nr:CoA binding domain-containing protein [Xylaria bambusicola]KAI0506543.1 CoA binding domain-containing protein [Xylaria bambusicola]